MDKCLITNLSTVFFNFLTNTTKLHNGSLEKETE